MMMKKKIAGVIILSSLGLFANTLSAQSQGGGIAYEQSPFVVEENGGAAQANNQNRRSDIAQSNQQAMNANTNTQNGQARSIASNGSGSASGNANAVPNSQPQYNVVERKTETQKIDRNSASNGVTQAVDYSRMGVVEKLVGNNVSPSQVRDLRQRVKSMEDAVYQNVQPTKCVPKEIHVSKDPTQPLPFIRLSNVYGTNINFLDATGKTWGIEQILWNQNSTTVNYNKRKANNGTMNVIANDVYAEGNISVSLNGNDIPVVISYKANERETDCQVYIRMVDRTSPTNKSYGIVNNTLDVSKADPVMYNVLHGVAPTNARLMKTDDNGVKVWLDDTGHFIIRTKYKIQNPEPISTVPSFDGYNVYKTPRDTLFIYEYNDVYGEFKVTR